MNIESNLTADNYVEIMLNEVKHYPKEPIYQVYVNNSLCLYELLINDYPEGKMFEYEQQATPYEVNDAILKNGKQKITLRLYPAPVEYNTGKDVFSPNTKCSILVRYYDNNNKNAKGVEVAQFALSTKVRMAGENNDVEIKEFEGEGRKYYEASFYFDAQIPYENEGWSKGQDLAKLDQKVLEKKTLEFYQKQWRLYQNRDINAIFSYLYNRDRQLNMSKYVNKKQLQEMVSQYLAALKAKELTMQPLKDYKMKFYGDRKMVVLEQTSMDIRLRGESSLWGLYKNESTKATFRDYYLYLPEGKKLEDGLEVIR